ncbi:MAG: NAD-dependent epimerase/dehydratase family protein [Acidobacteriia bacterium]|jgi:dihydroflavonol-4-reductase|nr:NAD-dependent epimerase/dehydratase family protein [Terriglobia bacterium]
MTALATPPRTLVTGASGFLGSHVVRQLVARGEPVRVLLRPSSQRRALDGLEVEYAWGDLRDPAALRAALRGVRYVFHVAADYRLWARHPREIYESNVTGTRNLLAAAAEAGVERFLYTSSVATIAVPRPGALPNEATETRLQEMIGHYKRSKWLAEQEARAAAQRGLPVVIVNPTTPVGPGDWKPTPTGRIILDFLRGQMPAYVDTGLNLVPVEDVAAGHLLARERGRPGERYILGGENLSLREILSILARITGRPAPRLRLPHWVAMLVAWVDTGLAGLDDRAPRVPLEGVRMARHRMFVDDSRARRELGFAPGSVAAALERAVRWYELHGYVPGSVARSVARAPAAA